MWQHVKLSVQIRPRDTLACCWDDKQPTNQQTFYPLLVCLSACFSGEAPKYWVAERASLCCNLCLRMALGQIVWDVLCMLLGKKATQTFFLQFWKISRRANAQTIHIDHTYRILNPPPPPPPKKKPTKNPTTHELSQTNKSIPKFARKGHQSFWCLIQLWPWMKVKGHQNGYQNVELSGLHHHTKFERKLSTNAWIHANKLFFFF